MMTTMTDEIHDEPGHILLVTIDVEPTDDDGNEVDTPFSWIGRVITGGTDHPGHHMKYGRECMSDYEHEREPEFADAGHRFITVTVLEVLEADGLHDERQIYGPLVDELIQAVPGTTMTLSWESEAGWHHHLGDGWPTPCDVHTPKEVKDELRGLAESYLSSPVCESAMYGHMLAIIGD